VGTQPFIRLCATWVTLTFGAQQSPTEDGFVPLFGDSSTRTIIGERQEAWSFGDDGSIVSRGPGSSWVLTKKEYEDFELRFEVKLSEDGDTGVTFRATTNVVGSPNNTQIQLMDEKMSQKITPRYRTGSLWDVVPPQKEGVMKPAGEWNDVAIVAKGEHLVARINNHVVVDVMLGTHKQRTADKGSGGFTHPDLLRSRGHIGFESWQGRAEFRRIRIKQMRLPQSPGTSG
jgi:hypothetical protein